jgi:orotidine-5'-phosphate decarboxylase
VTVGSFDPLDHIIWSADVPDERALWAGLDIMSDLRIVKLDRNFMEGRDFELFDRVHERGLLIFDDAKIIEVPSKVVDIAKGSQLATHLARRPWMLNCMAGIESNGIMEHENSSKIDGLKRFADACHAVGTRPCAVTVLTSKTPEVALREFNGRTPVEQVLYYVERLLECDFTDVVCSPKEAAAIRAERRFNKLDLNTPGIRWPDSDTRDQARVMTPDAAVADGADRLVIGSLLTESDDPAAELERIAGSIASVKSAA